jgi:uncharacterized protein
MHLDFTLLKGHYSIYRFDKDSAIPHWIYDSEFFSMTRTSDELSIVCKHADIGLNENIKIDKEWRILKINGPLDLSMIGIIADISSLFKENRISIFSVSTYDTDYTLIKDHQVDKALVLLKKSGHKVFIEN